MALHGHTKIELTDVNTGEVEIYEDDNMVTDALNSFFWSKGLFINTYLSDTIDLSSSSNRNWYYRGYVLFQLTHGLLLFDHFIEEDPKNTTPPGGAVMIGRGYDINYSGKDTTIGSYNSKESGTLYDGYGYKYVWDFGTSQGNGEIHSVCLTTMTGGRVGTGNTSDYPALNVSDDAFKGSFLNSIPILTSKSLWELDFDINTGEVLQLKNVNNFNFFPSSTSNTILDTSILKTGIVHFRKLKLPINELSIFDFQTKGSTCCKIIEEDIPIYLKNFENCISEEVLTTPYNHFFYKIQRDENNLYFILTYVNSPYYGTSSNFEEIIFSPDTTLCYIWKINPKTLEVDNPIILKNTTGVSIKWEGYFNYYGNNDNSLIINSYNRSNLLSHIIFCNNKAICHYVNNTTDYPNSYVAIDLNDQSQVSFFKSIANIGKEESSPSEWSGNFYAFSAHPCCLNNKVYVSESGYENSSWPRYKVFDLQNFSVSQVNSSLGGLGITNNVVKEVANNLIYYFNNSELYLTYFPTPLVTINNLPQIITKTTSQTMKVTYTIVDDEYAESIE